MQDIKKILVSRLRFIGDIILTTPLIKVLRETFPEAHIAYLAENPYISLLKNNPNLDELIGFDRLKYDSLKNFRDQVLFLTELRQRHFDLAIDLLGTPRSALQIWATGARYRIGGDFRGRKHFYNIRVRQDRPKISAIEFHLQSLKYLGINYDLPNLPTEVFTTPEEDRWAENYLISKGIDRQNPIVGIHPGGTWPAKLWPWERFAALATQLVRENKIQVFLTQGPNEADLMKKIMERVFRDSVTEGVGKVVLGDILELRQLAAVLKKCDLYISNDCGPMHLAVAVGTKTMGLFGPGEPDIWFPYDKKYGHRAIHHKMACWPCHKDFCDSLDCMKAIEVEEVLSVARDTLREQIF